MRTHEVLDILDVSEMNQIKAVFAVLFGDYFVALVPAMEGYKTLISIVLLLTSFAVAVVVSAEACCEDGVSSNRRVV